MAKILRILASVKTDETMKKIFLCAMLCIQAALFAAGDEAGDRITGIYLAEYEGEESKVSIFKENDGTYSAQVIWVKDKYDSDGNLKTDEKNPDKSKRDTPCDEIVLIEHMSYDSRKDCWTDAKIYDPVRGIKANVSCSFEEDGRLKVRGSLMGIGMSVYWEKIE